MFLGQFNHNLDYKGRIAIPKRFRQALTKAVLTRGLDGCLFLYQLSEWEKLATKVNDLPLTASSSRAFSRYLFSGAVEVSFDGLGRISVPDNLQKYAKLEKEAVIIGVMNRIEIWSKGNWEKFSKRIDKDSEQIAEDLSKSGV